MHVRSTILALALGALPAVSAHASAEGTSVANAPHHTDWSLSALPGQSEPLPGTATLQFEGGKVYGSDGCNRYAGTYTSTGTEFSMGEYSIVTKKACTEPVMRLAEAFMAALRTSNGLLLAAEKMVLLDARGNALATFLPQPDALAGTSWHVTAYANGRNAMVGAKGGTRLTLNFEPRGKLGGSAGCHVYAARYTLDGKALDIGPTTVTGTSCTRPAGVMAREARYLKALASTASYRMQGDRLELRNRNGGLVVTLSATENP